jgi:hypothetical protein
LKIRFLIDNLFIFTIRRTSSKKLAEDDVRNSFWSSDDGHWITDDFKIELATVGRVKDVDLGGRDVVGTVLIVVGWLRPWRSELDGLNFVCVWVL